MELYVQCVYKHYREKGFDLIGDQPEFLNNSAYKYADNNEDSTKTYDYASTEGENKYGMSILQGPMDTKLIMVRDSIMPSTPTKHFSLSI
ncbi:MAG: hypothetical protein R2764_00570 [Bacteroidales bacterium]